MPPLNPVQRSLLALALGNAAISSSNAATITVGTTHGGTPADQTCSLNEAIQSANNDVAPANSGCVNGNGADDIVFSDLVFTSPSVISLSTELPILLSSLTISGTDAGITIDGNNAQRVLEVYNGDIVLDKLIISGGAEQDGAGIRVEGSDASLTITNSTISNNKAKVDTYGGGIYISQASVSIENSIIEGNSAYAGAGIHLDPSGQLTIENSVLSNNVSRGQGGAAIYAVSSDPSSPAVLTISNSEISNNQTSYFPGGVVVLRESVPLSATMSNTTISQNLSNYRGTAIYSTSNLLTISNSTITGNTAVAGGGALFLTGDGVIENTILSGNQGGAPFDAFLLRNPNVLAENSIFGNASISLTESVASFTPGNTNILATNDRQNIAVESILSPNLADNGCVTPAGAPSVSRCVKTHALVAGSPAIDAAKATSCPDMDQIGNQRESESFFVVTKTNNDKVVAFSLGQDITCDIGAVQFTAP